MTFIDKGLKATWNQQTEVVPRVQHDGIAQAFVTDFPEPTEDQRRKEAQHHQQGVLMPRVKTAKNDGSQKITRTQLFEASFQAGIKPALNAAPEDGFFGKWCNQQQDYKRLVVTQRMVQLQAYLCSNPSASRPQSNNQHATCQDVGKPGLWGRLLHGVRMIALAGTCCVALPTFAGLGESENSIHGDQIRMHAHRSDISAAQYSVSVLRGTDGSVVKQYVSANGTVFAVSWHTQYKPDLSSLLGSSFSTYSVAAAQAARRPGIQRHFRHESLDLVVQATAHLNVFSGFAYRQSMLPSGINLQSLALE